MTAAHVTLPALVAAVAAPACWYIFDRVVTPTEEQLRTVIQVYTSVSVTMLGFTLAMLAILVSISGTRVVRNLNRTRHYGGVITRLFVSAACFGIVLVASIACLFMLGTALMVGTAISSGLLISACVALALGSYKFWLVLKLVHTENGGRLE